MSQELYIKLLDNLAERISETHEEILSVRTGLQQLVELECNVGELRRRLHEAENSLESLRDALKDQESSIATPLSVWKICKTAAAIAFVAVITFFVNDYLNANHNPPPPIVHKAEKAVDKKPE